MHEQVSDPCEWLLQEWHLRREVVESYQHALQLLIPLDSRQVSQPQRESVRDLNEKLATALLALRRASAQLRICEQEQAVIGRMALTHAPQTRSRRRRRVGLLAGAVLILAAGVVMATVTVEPLRAHLWAAVGASCGTVVPAFGGARQVGGAANEQCLQRAAQRCQAATLDFGQGGIDTSSTITVVIEPAVPHVAPCGIAALWVNDVDGGAIRRSGMERCTSLAVQSDGLHVYGCGSLGDIVVPA